MNVAKLSFRCHLLSGKIPSRLQTREGGRMVSTTSGPTSGFSKSQMPQITDLLEGYRGLVARGQIQYDEDQVRVVMALRKLGRTLKDYSPPVFVPKYYSPRIKSSLEVSQHLDDSDRPWYSPSSESNAEMPGTALMITKTRSEELAELETPKGVLLTGPPGSGKSFLVDLWLTLVPTPHKIRKHYSQFVLEIYRGVWEETRRRMRIAKLSRDNHSADEVQEEQASSWTKAAQSQWKRLLASGKVSTQWRSPTTTVDPPISYTIAQRLVYRYWLLVLDELQLLDVSSAGLLADVLEWYWRMGGVLVATSNKVPDDLYRAGTQRERLEPFVEALKSRCPVHEMKGECDWRRGENRIDTESSWFTFGQSKAFEDRVAQFFSTRSPLVPRIFSVFGRDLVVPLTSGDACIFAFSELCQTTLGAADYATIASNFRTVIIKDIPILRLSAKNESRRFITLLDALYECRCRLIALAEAVPDDLFFPDALDQSKSDEIKSDNSSVSDMVMAESFSESRELFRPNISSYHELPERPAASPLSLEKLSIFSGEEERFAYRRAVSRLHELTSPSFWEKEQWNPLDLESRGWERSEVPDTIKNIAVATDIDEKKQRPPAPVLKPDHVWGVRDDWGDRAGEWGRGASVFDDGKKK